MDVIRARRLISAFGQWLGIVQLINEKARLRHLQNTQTFSFTLPEQRDAVMENHRQWDRKSEAVRAALVNGYGPALAIHAWPAVVDITVTDPHFLVLALEHCFSAVKALRRELDPFAAQDAHNAIDEYCKLWLQVRDVRHALEHEEE